MTLTANEQLLLELINRARLDPLGEAARYGIDLNKDLAPGTLGPEVRQVLAPNGLLADAAEGHSQWMLANDTFSHTGAGGSTPTDRMRAAGYPLDGAYHTGENLAYVGSSAEIDPTQSIYQEHENLFLSPHHRPNILGNDFREIGVDQSIGVFTQEGVSYNASMVTENFALSGNSVFVTGVIYADTDANRFYSVGEGRSGVAISAGGQSTQSQGAGGYALALDPMQAADVTLGSGAGAITVTADLSQGNAKIDLMGGVRVLSSVDLTLGTNATVAALLGAADLTLAGNDDANRLVGNSGDNLLTGADGSDTLRGALGDDTLEGGAGDDHAVFYIDRAAATISVDGDSIVVESSLGHDVLHGIETLDFDDQSVTAESLGIDPGPGPSEPTAGDDSLEGSADPDMIVGLAGNDTIVGLAGDDTLGGAFGNDLVVGGDGDDALYGAVGNDLIYGGAGNDTVVAGANFDTVWGGAGDDRVDGGDGRDTVHLGAGADIFFDNGQGGELGRDIVFAEAGNDTIQGGNGDDQFHGQNGNDLIYGRLGDDLIGGGAGSDTLAAGEGNDTVDGGFGRDTAWLGGGDDLFTDNGQGGVLGRDTVHAGAGDDTVQGGAGDDNVFGQYGNDLIYGRLGNDRIDGGVGYDTIGAGDGDDTVIGGDGRDSVYLGTGNDLFIDSAQTGPAGGDLVFGDAGDDTIRAGGGQDTLGGGEGADTFVFGTGAGIDLITDFQAGTDVLTLDDALWDAQDLTREQVVDSFGDIVNGTAVFDFGSTQITLDGISDLTGFAASIEIV